MPVKIGVADSFRVEAHRALDGSLLWQLDTDYTLPPHNWTPSYSPTLTPANTLYFAGAGGTVYTRSSPDSTGGAVSQIAFYGNANYLTDPSTYNANVKLNQRIRPRQVPRLRISPRRATGGTN